MSSRAIQHCTYDQPEAPKAAPETDGPSGQDQVSAGGWGLLPVLFFTNAVGLLIVAIAYSLARQDSIWAMTIYWIGLLVLLAPNAIRLVSPATSRQERLIAILLLSTALYIIRVFYAPFIFAFGDEFQHWRTASDILQSNHLFTPNPLLPISPYYPGLENIVSVLNKICGLDVFRAGILLIGVARFAMILGLFLFLEKVSKSGLITSVALLVYMSNPLFMFFDDYFIYESLGLALATVILYLIAFREDWTAPEYLPTTVAIIVMLGALIVTHHLTTYMLIGILGVWTLCSIFVYYRWREGTAIRWTAVLAFVMSAIWLIYVATLTVGYIAPTVSSGIRQLIQLISGEAVGRQLFKTSTTAPPAWEQVSAYLSTGLIILASLVGAVIFWFRIKKNAFALALILVALSYPASLPLRFTAFGVAIAGRLPEFLFLGSGFSVAIVVAWLLPNTRIKVLRIPYPVRTAFVIGCLIVIFVGGIVAGWGPITVRLPGPYLPAAHGRSFDASGISAALWMKNYLGRNQRIATDWINQLLMGSLGDQKVVTEQIDKTEFFNIFFLPQLTPNEIAVVKKLNVSYIEIDRRMSTGLPVYGNYIESNETNANNHTQPFDPVALAKFDYLPAVSRLYDSGDIQIYDVRNLDIVP